MKIFVAIAALQAPVFGIAHVASKSGIAPVASESACQTNLPGHVKIIVTKVTRHIGPRVSDMESAVATDEKTNTVILPRLLESSQRSSRRQHHHTVL